MVAQNVMRWLALALVLGLVVGYPWWGWYDYRRLQRRLGFDPGALGAAYVRWVWQSWLIAGLALAVSSPFGSASWFHLSFDLDEHQQGFLVGASLAFSVGLALPLVLMRKKFQALLFDTAGALLPKTGRERWLFAALAVTAGITEEVTYRGFLNHWLTGVGGLGATGAVGVGAVIFGVGHWYQGWKGVLSTAFMGFAMGQLFLTTGSLWVPMLVHALIDLRVLLMLPKRSAPAASLTAGTPG